EEPRWALDWQRPHGLIRRLARTTSKATLFPVSQLGENRRKRSYCGSRKGLRSWNSTRDVKKRVSIPATLRDPSHQLAFRPALAFSTARFRGPIYDESEILVGAIPIHRGT